MGERMGIVIHCFGFWVLGCAFWVMRFGVCGRRFVICDNYDNILAIKIHRYSFKMFLLK